VPALLAKVSIPSVFLGVGDHMGIKYATAAVGCCSVPLAEVIDFLFPELRS
jgi:hypothetical protein